MKFTTQSCYSRHCLHLKVTTFITLAVLWHPDVSAFQESYLKLQPALAISTEHYNDYGRFLQPTQRESMWAKALTQEEREKLKRRREYYESLPPEEQRKIKQARDRYKDMQPEEKQRLRKRWEEMTPEERKQYKKWKHKQKTGQ